MPNEGYEVFLSYAHETSLEHAKHLETDLQAAGVRVFRDESSIPYGAQFPDRIVDALPGSRVFVAFVDPAYHASNSCTRELAAALMDFDFHPSGAVELGHIIVARRPSPPRRTSVTSLQPTEPTAGLGK